MPDIANGTKRYQQLIGYLIDQDQRKALDRTVEYAVQWVGLSESTALKVINYLQTEGLLTSTDDMEGTTHLVPQPSLGRHLSGAVKNQLAIWCSPEPGEEEETRRRKRGAPAGNMNALKHGRYSQLMQQYRTNPDPSWTGTSLRSEIASLRALLTHIEDMEITPIDLFLKVINTIRLTAIAQHAMDLHPVNLGEDPKPYEEEGGQWNLPAKPSDAPDESPPGS